MNQIFKSSFFIEFDSFLLGNFPSQTYARAYIYEAPIPYLEIALEGLKKFQDDDPALYQNVAATFYEMGWRKEVIEVLKKGVEKFLGDE
jgi:hypothetical protein